RLLFETHLDQIIHNLKEPSARIVQAMTYSLKAGGKRLRPILCIAACQAVHGPTENCLNAACAIEMIHTYSLIHDDLPALDNDSLRRGKPTCHTAFDESTGILAGDGLLTLAFELLASRKDQFYFNADRQLRVIYKIATACGYQGMIEGQMRDLASEKKPLTISELETMHSLKTGALIEASVFTGAVLGNGTPEQINALSDYAQHIGIAFQVVDDILNVTGDPEIMGKAVGSDEKLCKATYPSIVGIEKSHHIAKQRIQQAIDALGQFDNDADPLREIALYILHRNK
ncbi:MAG: polyprenyl synthetase family protein, partial [Desulfobacterales bacterium]|nr:polyprenyl synthetase family protein [Desulfobacterales bacterium]